MKRPIEWHANGLANHIGHVRREREAVERAIQALEESEKRLRIRQEQHAEAIRRGLTEYDADKFFKPRKSQSKEGGEG